MSEYDDVAAWLRKHAEHPGGLPPNPRLWQWPDGAPSPAGGLLEQARAGLELARQRDLAALRRCGEKRQATIHAAGFAMMQGEEVTFVGVKPDELRELAEAAAQFVKDFTASIERATRIWSDAMLEVRERQLKALCRLDARLRPGGPGWRVLFARELRRRNRERLGTR